MLEQIYTIVLNILTDIKASEWTSLLSGVFSVLGGLFAFFYGWLARRSEHKLQVLEAQVSKVDSELIEWGLNSINALSAAHGLLATKGSGREVKEIRILRDEIQIEVSALVDSGRIYFLNRSPDLVGLDRAYANRGYRPAILDALMIAHEELRVSDLQDDGEYKRSARNVFASRQIFVAELRKHIDRLRDPKALEKLKAADDDWSEVGKLVDDFEGRKGVGTFWKDRPKSRREILAFKRAST